MAKPILRHQRMPRSVLATTLALNMAVLPMTLSAEEVSEEIIEEVVVTGSRIATTNETSSQPLLSISSDALTSSGQLDISEVLNDIVVREESDVVLRPHSPAPPSPKGRSALWLERRPHPFAFTGAGQL